MPIPIQVPRLGWSMEEGTFVGWLKQDGDSVEPGEPLFTLEGDKASQEVEATDRGILRLPSNAPKPGTTVCVGALLGYLVEDKDSSLPTEPASTAAATDAARTSGADGGAAHSTGREALASPGVTDSGRTIARVAISPRARRRAAELGLDYRGLKGSGRTGRIVEADVLKAAQASSAPTSMRRTIAQRTVESFGRVPHFYLRTEVGVGALLEHLERLRPEIEQATGLRLTLTDLLLRAQAMALRDCPDANGIWQDGRVRHFQACDVGLVVGVGDGLLMPVVRAADAGDLVSLVRQRVALIDGARAGKLSAAAMQGGATSLSNLGNTCVDEFAAVIAPSQSSMLAVGRAAPRPFVVDGALAVHPTLKLCLSVDHRVMDGTPAAKFLGRMVELIRQPAELARG